MADLSKREKLLLYILLCVAILAGGLYLLVLPAMDSRLEVKDQLSAKQSRREQVEQTISAIDSDKQSLQTIEQDIAAFREKFLSGPQEEDIDSLITYFMQSSGVRPQKLEMQPPAAFSLPAYGQQPAADSESDPGGEPQVPVGGVQVVVVQVSGQGTIEDVTAMADLIHEMPYLRIAAMDVTLPSGYTYESGAYDVIMDLEVYLYEQPANDSENQTGTAA